MTEGHDRKLRPAEPLEVPARLDRLPEQAGLVQVALDRVAEGLRAVGAHREPQLQRAERARVLERDVDRVELVPLMRQVALLVREGRDEVLLVAHEHDPAGLREVEPLVRVDRRRLRARDPGEQLGAHRRGRQAVRAVDVQPHAALLADVGDGVEGIDRPRERRPRRRDHRDRGDPVGAIAIDRLGQRLGDQPAIRAERDRAQVPRPDPERLDRARDRVVHLLRAVHGDAMTLEALEPALRQRELPCGRERARVGERPAARERAGRVLRVADELRRPPDRLLLDLRRRARVHREVDVVGVREQVADRADLQAARPDEGEVPGPRLGDRLVEDPGGVVERLVDRRRQLGERGAKKRAHALVQRGLLGPVPVEGPPGLGDELHRVLERVLPRRVESERPIGLRHGVDGTPAPSTARVSGSIRPPAPAPRRPRRGCCPRRGPG